ncbi:unnamed protein product, partial [Cladocopium goreaui]
AFESEAVEASAPPPLSAASTATSEGTEGTEGTQAAADGRTRKRRWDRHKDKDHHQGNGSAGIERYMKKSK